MPTTYVLVVREFFFNYTLLSGGMCLQFLLFICSDFIWDFGKLPFPTHLGKYFIKIGKIRAKIHEIGNELSFLDWE